ncbi:hypothetical protein, partial [Trichlorobacter lovleyi]|uniref:hypothetical protein n=1 Tax=Trichlorobacter lovleyi TaxID=313985 RepID=UPI003D0D20F5
LDADYHRKWVNIARRFTTMATDMLLVTDLLRRSGEFCKAKRRPRWAFVWKLMRIQTRHLTTSCF